MWVLAALTVLAVLIAMPAGAGQPQCATHKAMAGYLDKVYREAPVGLGTINADRYVQLFVAASGTWTVLVTGLDGMSCIVAAGQNWERVEPGPGTGTLLGKGA